MLVKEKNQIELILNQLFKDAQNDGFKIMKSFIKSAFRDIKPIDFKDAYLSISKNQGENLAQLIKDNTLKNIVEFGTSFGISTLYLAKGALETKGSIITTEIIPSKAKKAIENFKKANVLDFIEVRIGDAMQTLENHNTPIDLLFLDGWKDLYLPLFKMLESNFYKKTIIYVDNANMAVTETFLNTIRKNPKYQFTPKFNGKVVLIHLKY